MKCFKNSKKNGWQYLHTWRFKNSSKKYTFFLSSTIFKDDLWDNIIYDGSMRFHVIEYKLEAGQNVRNYSARRTKFQNVRGHKWPFANFRQCIPEKLIYITADKATSCRSNRSVLALFMHRRRSVGGVDHVFIQVIKQHTLRTTFTQITVCQECVLILTN